MHAFDPNDYRKRVLAAVERRGGIEQSDPFELYDIPLDEAETLGDAEVSARVAEVWGFWQRQRDHPKYRVLVGLLVENHDRLSFLLLDASARRAEAIRIRREREQRDAERYEMLDTAISRLVQRHGGVPAAKVPGLEEIGAMGGLNAAEVAARLRRHRIIEDERPQAAPAVTGALTDQRRGQIRALLTEWGRLVEDPPPPTLLGLLGLDPSRATHTGEIRLRADALRARARELPPGRMRVVLDELLVHVQDLLEPGGPVVAEYVASIVEDVTAELRPKVRAAVLVEDELVGEDYEFLFDEAIALGMDPHAAGRLLEDLAVELGSRAVGSARHAPPVRTPASSAPSPAPPRRLWEEPLKAARAALRNGRPQEAARHIAEARGLDPHNEGTTPIRSVSDDVERVLAEAALHWRVALAARAATRYVEALEHLRELRRTAADVPPPTGHTVEIDELLAEAERAVAEADRLVAAAAAGPAADRSRTLRAAQAACVDHPGASEAMAATPIPAPGRVTVTRMANGSVRVVWVPVSAEDVNYRVTRLQPDGSWRVVGRTRGTELEDGGAPPGETPVYAVAAAISGSYSDTVRSDAPPEPGAHRTAPPGATGSSGSMAQTAAVGAGGSTIAHGTVVQPDSGFPPGQATQPNPAVRQTSGSVTEPSGVARPDPATTRPEQTAPQAATSAVAQDDPMPSGIPVVTSLAERAGLLTFVWPTGITEVMVVARTDGPPAAPDEPEARAWKVTNMRYEIDGGVRVPPDLPRPCHIAVASCRREPNGKLTVAAGFAPDARIHWTHA
ncbi:Ig-like domain repeat protein [Nocardia xishanensis]|uniref:Ig-like domain repeat protein n=1 Tax=Nocardia xishanensis TaxID=238964 RepID=UPI00341D45A8